MAEKNGMSLSGLESVGWRFYLAVILVLVGPAIYLCWEIVLEDSSPMVPIMMGAIAASFAAGFVSWGVNSVLQHRVNKKRAAARKKAKKH